MEFPEGFFCRQSNPFRYIVRGASHPIIIRVQSIDFGYRQITVYNGKAANDRFVPLPDSLTPALEEHIKVAQRLSEEPCR